MVVSLWRNLQRLSAGKNSTSYFTFFLTYLLQRYYKPLVVDTLSMSGYAHHKGYYRLVENFYVYLQAKSQLYLPCFYRDIAKIWNLFWVLVWNTLLHSLKMMVSPCKRLQLFICMQKTNFIIHFFLSFRKCWKLIGWQHFGP